MAATLLSMSKEPDVLKPVQENIMKSSSSPNPTKRLTMVERARLEALASFGNQGLDSLSVKNTDFSSKLKSKTPSADSKTLNMKPLTRMQRARIEANEAFKNVQLGQMTSNPKKRKIQDSDGNENSKKTWQTTLTRIQKAKLEAAKAFENVSLDEIPPKKSKLEREKLERKLLEGKKDPQANEVRKDQRLRTPLQEIKPVLNPSKKSDKKPRGCMDTNVRSVGTNTPNKRLTRSQSAKIEALECCNDSEIENPYKNHCIEPKSVSKDSVMISNEVAMETNHGKVSGIAPQNQEYGISSVPDKSNRRKKLTRLEKAKLEALQSFSGQEFSDICKYSTRIVAKHLKPKKDQSCNTEDQELCNTPHQASENHDQDTPAQGESPQILDKPVQIHRQPWHKRPRVDVYTSILEGSFKDQTSLLETSRRVVETAKQLETPEGSPLSATS